MRVWLSGRALASQAEGRGFDPRHPLAKRTLVREVLFLSAVLSEFRPGGWNGSFDGERFLLYRMCECYSSGVEGNASVRVGTRRAIFEVTLYRAAHIGKLASYLMVAACKQLYFKQEIPLCLTYIFIYELCQFGIFAERPLTADV